MSQNAIAFQLSVIPAYDFVTEFIKNISLRSPNLLDVYCQIFSNWRVQKKFQSLKMKDFVDLLTFLREKSSQANLKNPHRDYFRLYNLVFNTFLVYLPDIDGQNGVTLSLKGSGARLSVIWKDGKELEVALAELKEPALCMIVRKCLPVIPEPKSGEDQI